MEKITRKDLYNESIIDMRTHINGETAIKPYHYMRNGVLHVRYTVDRCVKLSKAEETKIKIDLTANPENKQKILADAWNFLTNMVGKEIILDGVAEMEKTIKGFKNEQNGHKN